MSTTTTPTAVSGQLPFEVVATGLRFPESPVLTSAGELLLVELAGGCLTKVDLSSGTAVTVADLGGSPNGVALGPDGQCYVCNSGGFEWTDVGQLWHVVGMSAGHDGGWVERVDLFSGSAERMHAGFGGSPLLGPSDLVVDSAGGFYFTDKRPIGSTASGRLFYVDSVGALRCVRPRMDDPNGIALSADGRTLFAADTLSRSLFAWPVDGPGQLGDCAPPGDPEHGNGRRVYQAPEGHRFDGVKAAPAGEAVVATLGDPGGLTVIDPATGRARFHALPERYVTNVWITAARAYVTLGATGRLVAVALTDLGVASDGGS
jgi:gluconolactonase